MISLQCVVPKNIHTPHTEGFFGLTPPSPGNSSLGSYIPLKILPFKTPSPSEFPMTFCGGCIDIFWNYTIRQFLWYPVTNRAPKNRSFEPQT